MHCRFTTIAALILSLIQSSFASEYTPCPNQCSSNGICTRPWGVCSCFDGFTGADCSLRPCPFGLISWADSAISNDSAHHAAECSNRGKCDRELGECMCEYGFGDLPLLIPDGTHLGQTSAADTPIITSQKVVTGDKETDICSNHGT